MALRGNTYNGEPQLEINLQSIQKVIRESAGQQMPPGAVPEDRVAPSTQDGDVTSTVNGKTVWVPSEDLSGVIGAHTAADDAATAAQEAADDAAAAQAAADQAAIDAATVSGDLADHFTDTTAHPAAYITLADVGGNYVASDVEAALDEAADAILAHVNDTTAAHDGSAISVNPSGLIVVSGTTAQAAVAQIDAGLVTNAAAAAAAQSTANAALPKAGGTMSGAIAMGSNKVTGLAAATANGDAVRYEQAILQSLLTTSGDKIERDGSGPIRVPNCAVRVFCATQSIATNSLVTVAFSAETFDTNSMHDNATDNSKLFAPIAGTYQGCAHIYWPNNVTGKREIIIYINGAVYEYLMGPPTGGADATQQALPFLAQIGAGGNAQVVVRQNSGSALTISATFEMHRVGAM